ncbi:MAG TPA: efflux RND transporter periplasmic adaptor subunit [Gemmataceae bacterium]|nr:efflux RND transporter periplasmic adaptor subunit [Gemmataceae bacterium]
MSERFDNNHPVSSPPVGTQTEPSGRTVSLKERVRSLRLPEHQTRTAPSSAWLPWALCVLLAGASAFLGYRAYFAAPVAEAEKPAGPQLTVAEPTSPLTKPSGRVALVAGGYIIPVQRVQVSPKVGGEVVKLYIEEGQYVEKGQPLAELDRTKYEFEYNRLAALAEQARAEWEKLKNGNRPEERKQAEAALREAELLREQLRDELSRLHRSRTAAAAEEIVRVESRLSQAEAKVEQLRQAYILMEKGWREEEIAKAESAYKHAVAQRDSAKYDLDCTTVVAPISGTILVKRAEVGNTVRPEAFSNGLSASLCDMADLTKLEVDVDVSERDLNAVFKGQECEIRTEAPSDTVYRGRVVRLMPEANRSKASVSVRVQIDVPPGDTHLRPEMRARVTFLAREKDKNTSK